MSEAIDLGEIAARVEADDTVTAQEFIDTVSDMDRAMIRSGHHPGTAYTYATGQLAGMLGETDANALLAVLADTAQFVKDNR